MAEDVDTKQSKSCCLFGETMQTFFSFVFIRCLLLSIYTLDISSDISVAYGDYLEGNEILSYITLGLVFLPGIFFSLYMFCDSCWSFAGDLACIKSILWLLVTPILPLWPIFRDLKQILLGLKATLRPAKRKAIIQELKAPSRTYLLKFLEAFTEAAPQLVVRLLKICLKNPFPFVGFRTSEIVQICLSLFILSLNVISTHQKSVSTKQVLNGELESPHKYSLTCIGQIFALAWWLTFILTRIQAIVLFTSVYNYWIFLILGIHVGLIFVIQTIATAKDGLRRIIIYFFGAFVFIFAYVQFNLTSKVKVGAWISYVIFTVMVFVENIIMLTCWLYRQNTLIDFYIEVLQDTNGTEIYQDYYHSQENSASFTYVTENSADSEIIRKSIQHHNEKLLFLHYGLFTISLIFMTLTFMCPFTNNTQDNIIGNEEEMTQIKCDS